MNWQCAFCAKTFSPLANCRWNPYENPMTVKTYCVPCWDLMAAYERSKSAAPPR